MAIYRDEDQMEFGKFRGVRMVDIPEWYFKRFWNNNVHEYKNNRSSMATIFAGVMDYIDDHFDDVTKNKWGGEYNNRG